MNWSGTGVGLFVMHEVFILPNRSVAIFSQPVFTFAAQAYLRLSHAKKDILVEKCAF